MHGDPGRPEPGACDGASSAAEGIRDALQRVLKCPRFAASERGRKFLSFVCEEALAGRAERIKAYSIAVQVLGRHESFNAQNDPIVRVEAGRIRRALEHYYLTDGIEDPVEIRIEKGGYAPTFLQRTPARPAPANDHARAPGSGNRATRPAVPELCVVPFEDLSGTQLSRTLARGLTAEVTTQLARFREIVVLSGTAPGEAPKAGRYELTGTLLAVEESLHLSVRLTDAASGAVIWANAFDEAFDPRSVIQMILKIASAISVALAQSYGVIFQAESSRIAADPQADWEAYRSTLAYYAYLDDVNAEAHARVRDGLRRTVERYPGYSVAWGLLAWTMIDAFRFRFEPATPGALQDALSTARHALRLDGQNARALQAEMAALFLSGEIDVALDVGARALELNPNDAQLRAEYGLRLAQSGAWERGEALMAEALYRDPGPIHLYHQGIAVCQFMRGDLEAAAVTIRTIKQRSSPLHHLIAATIFGELGEIDAAHRERLWLEQNAPHVAANVFEAVAFRIIRAEDQARVLTALAKAGFAVSEGVG